MNSYILKLIEENKKLKEQLRKQIEEIDTTDALSHKLSRFCCIMRTNKDIKSRKHQHKCKLSLVR